MPPVAKTGMPAAWAAIIVADTVVAAQPPSASAIARRRPGRLPDRPGGRGREGLEVSSATKPTRSRPSWIATVAGTAPASRTAASEAVRDLEVLRIRQPVADQRRFERDDGAPVASAVGDVRRDRPAAPSRRARWPCPKRSGPATLSRACPTPLAR